MQSKGLSQTSAEKPAFSRVAFRVGVHMFSRLRGPSVEVAVVGKCPGTTLHRKLPKPLHLAVPAYCTRSLQTVLLVFGTFTG